MSPEILYIKNMVCQRCLKVVKEVLDELHIDYAEVVLGEVKLKGPLSADKQLVVSKALREQGFDLLDDQNAKTVEKIKNIIISYVHHPEEHPQASRLTFSKYLAQTLTRDYTALSQLFSSVEGITIEKYLIHQKVERVKELLKYGELTLTEIAYTCGYSSVQYLSNQFKRVTGMSPGDFRQLGVDRKGIDTV